MQHLKPGRWHFYLERSQGIAELFRSAMSMPVFYTDRAGKNLNQKRRRILEQAKQALRNLYGRG